MEPGAITVRELAAAELPRILPLIEKHNPKVEPAELRRRLGVMIPQGYRCIAALDGERVVGVAGYWTGTRFYCGEYLEPDNVFVEESDRSRGIGLKLMEWLHTRARETGCKVIWLNSYTSLTGAHRFYVRQGYDILGFYFSRKAD